MSNNKLLYPPFLESEFTPQPLREALFAVLPVPLEKTVSYGHGTKRGPSAILCASQQLEAVLDTMKPGERGIATLPPVACEDDIETVLSDITMKVRDILAASAIPVVLGGEHTVTLGALRAFAAQETRLPGIVHFDAHADLRETYEGTLFSHACVMHRAVADLGYRLVQFGIREVAEEEVAVQRLYGVLAHTADALFDAGLPTPVVPEDFPSDVYVSFDVDCFDASLMPETGTPSPGGLFWQDVRRILQKLARTRRIVGFDVVELAPSNQSVACSFTAAKLAYFLMAQTLASFSSQA